jgi:hypothetical protein
MTQSKMLLFSRGCLMRVFNRFSRDEGGNFAVAAAVLSLPLVAGAGMVLTYGSALTEKNNMQNMLDAAVLAGTTLGHSATDDLRLAAAYSLTDDAVSTFGGSPDVSIAVGSDPVFTTTGTNVIGLATISMANPFAGVIGDEFIELQVRAEAEKRESEPICLLALDRQSPAALNVFGNAVLSAPNCVAMTNSKSQQAIKQFGNKADITALRIGVTGGSSGPNVKPAPTLDVAPVDDPYAGVPIPKAGSCEELKGKLAKGSFELGPGTYCGGLNISPGATVDLLPGVYVMKDGPLEMGANSILRGENVMIAFIGADSVLNTNSGSVLTLSSPSTGTYKNIQFLSDRTYSGKPTGVEVATLSSTTLTYDGVMYLPEQTLWIKGKTVINAKSPAMAMIADRYRIQDASEVNIVQENERGIDVSDAPGFKFSARLSR